MAIFVNEAAGICLGRDNGHPLNRYSLAICIAWQEYEFDKEKKKEKKKNLTKRRMTQSKGK